MSNKTALEIENFFIIDKKVYQVYRIEKLRSDDEQMRIIHYRPYYLDDNNKTLLCSIPESNLELLNPRKPISKSEMQKLLQFATEEVIAEGGMAEDAQAVLKSNDIYKITRVLKTYWRVHKGSGEIGTKAVHKDINDLINRVAEELALINNLTRDIARTKIIAALDK